MAGTHYPTPLGVVPPSPEIDAGTLARTKSPLAGPVGLTAPGAIAAKGGGAPPPIGTQVVNYARGRRGRRVGDGQCFALADRALRNAGAKSAADFGQVTEDGDYVWGTAISLSEAQPGDIVQFRDYTFREDRADGSWHSESRPHHTAIVVSSQGDGLLTVIEQNAPEGSAVHQIQLGFRSGTTASGSTLTVSGQVWFYRPQAK